MDPYYRGMYRAWWREHALRESLAAKTHKLLGEKKAEREKSGAAKTGKGGPGWMKRMLGGK